MLTSIIIGFYTLALIIWIKVSHLADIFTSIFYKKFSKLDLVAAKNLKENL